MSKGIFITATGTDVGKTFVSALLLKALNDADYDCTYYKAALSGADNLKDSDAGYVSQISGAKSSISYMYKTPVSPHLAAQLEGNPVCLDTVINDFNKACAEHEYVVVEGSGGIVCPIRWDNEHIMLSDIVKALHLSVLIIADAGLGTINSTVLTVQYLKSERIPIAGIVFNHYTGNEMQHDNAKMVEEITNVPIVYYVADNQTKADADIFAKLFKEVF